ncbi:hypothetical protein AUJ77_01720 [Candidatus Nomurabacteria bacterium CG1_02_43_90]|uniref:HTH HARE-type domain-containing protein n=1 Tax=Candidatus Nomurabacteria bacterium CG1_02_43_90 TaxID=1805281 RepID=A0A1J4V7T7_9BACT|nr:MAG: hypothetical protein AUJ77_01720 [Candidatus Nomurabacteria bacterium CG1_02_43_90]
MNKDPKKIVEQIFSLVTELAEMTGHKISALQSSNKPLPKAKTSGTTGGIRGLVDEGYLDDPKLLPEIIERLKQEGRHYSNAAVSMGLLNLVRERVLTRFRDKDKKIWKYVIRK